MFRSDLLLYIMLTLLSNCSSGVNGMPGMW
ncbi:hypothetical protein LINPERHAP2_LOCUS43701, partial [Linum perenne]